MVSALFALAANNAKLFFILLAYFPAIAFWVLDGYFLHQEKLFRALYDQVRELDEEDIDFSMDTSAVVQKVDPWSRVVVSKTVLIFHGSIFGSILIVMLFMIFLANGGT